MDPDTNLVDTAVRWSSRMGWNVFPTCNRRPLVPWKSAASRDEAAIRSMPWDAANGYGVALPVGTLVVDMDTDDSRGSERLAAAWDTLQTHMPEVAHAIQTRRAFLVGTPSGGIHAYFRHEYGSNLRQTSFQPGVDLRVGGSGYVVGPGSPGYSVLAWGSADLMAIVPRTCITGDAMLPFLRARM